MDEIILSISFICQMNWVNIPVDLAYDSTLLPVYLCVLYLHVTFMHDTV